MTEREKIIATAYTGIMFVSNFSEVHKYIEDKLGRPVWTHEMPNIQDEIRKAVKDDFIKMLKGDYNGSKEEPGEAGERKDGNPTGQRGNSKTKK